MNNCSLHEFFSSPLIFGHRGYSSLAPENTLSAFSLCADRGVDGIELDVQFCRTGELVVFHDFTLKRITGAEGNIVDISYNELRSFDAGSHFNAGFSHERIPLLEDLFKEFGSRFHYDIELKDRGKKDNGLAGAVLALIRKYSLESYCLVSSFNPFQVRAFRKSCAGTIPTAVIYADTPKLPRWLRHGKGRYVAGCSALKPHYPLITEAVVQRDKQKRGFPVIAWTVDDPDEAGRLSALGIDGIISNDPGKLKGVFP